MHLDCYKIYDVAPQMVPARSNRDWMDAFTDRHPYRCLPLTMANSTGWELLCPMDIKIKWNGGTRNEDIQILTRGDPNAISSFADAHFMRGIVTFHTVPCSERVQRTLEYDRRVQTLQTHAEKAPMSGRV